MSALTVKRVSLALALVLIGSVPGGAQLVNGKWQAPARPSGGASAAPRQGVQVRRENDAAAATVPVANGSVLVRVIHAVVMSDGSIVADFGTGLEVVRRACPSAVANMPLRIIGAPVSTQPVPGLQTVPGIQPPPAQSTPSQLALPSAQSRAPSKAALSSCHLRDQRGRAFATR